MDEECENIKETKPDTLHSSRVLTRRTLIFAQLSKRDITHVSGIPDMWKVFHERKHWREEAARAALNGFNVLGDSHDRRVPTVTACPALMPSERTAVATAIESARKIS